jgi:NAD-dependent dihydropyrimidine dehydrogenase PreA subunit
MAYKVSEECIACSSCLATCPISAIIEGNSLYDISEKCVECGACVAVCPVGAILAP